MKKWFSRFVFVLLVWPAVFADPPESIHIQIQGLAVGDLPEDLYLNTDVGWVPFSASTTHFGRALMYQGENPVRVYQRRSTEEGYVFDERASILVAEEDKDVVFLAGTKDGSFKINPVSINPDFPVGSFYFINQLDFDIDIHIADQRVSVVSRESVVHHPKIEERGVIPFGWSITNPPNDVRNTSLNGSRLYHPQRWYFVFISQDGNAVVFRSVTRFP